MNDIQNIKNEALSQIMSTNSVGELEEIRITYLGRNGKLKNILKKIKEIPPEERKEYGIVMNEAKRIIENEIKTQENKMRSNSREWFDPTIPAIKPSIGTTHLITKAIEEIEDIFSHIGFTRQRYPEVEWDWFSFGALNFPDNHPARDDWETFFIDSKIDTEYGPMLLTPHTSSGQVREMLSKKPPIRMINISKTYRRQSDPSHNPMFHQFEGLVVDKNINISHLKGTLNYFFKNYYDESTKFRIRPYHFQFTEPSFEVDITCQVCSGKGCKLCKEGWIELGGAGMVHPNVLKACNVNFKEYSGFAFGWGVERVLMMRKGVNLTDLRYLYSTDVNILKQF